MTDGKAAVLSRSRRATAGKRMSALVGQALEDDEQFWTHSTWKEEKNSDDSSDDGSYDLNDEAEENRIDVFDSDFNDSESEEEEGDDENAERRALLDDKAAKKKGKYTDPNKVRKTGRDLLRRKKVRRDKAVGSGANAGIVLNVPPDLQMKALGANGSNQVAAGKSSRSTTSNSSSKKSSPKTLASFRSRRIKHRSLRNATKQNTADSKRKSKLTERDTARRSKVLAITKKKIGSKRKFSQEELLVEAVNETEAENERWILGRKRVQACVEEKKKIENSKRQCKTLSKFHSKRGCYNTITFPDPKLMPAVLQQPKTTRLDKNEKCVITGMKAKYKDPLTGMPYFSVEAFRELRRRHRNHEPLVPTDASIDKSQQSNLAPEDKKQELVNVTICGADELQGFLSSEDEYSSDEMDNVSGLQESEEELVDGHEICLHESESSHTSRDEITRAVSLDMINPSDEVNSRSSNNGNEFELSLLPSKVDQDFDELRTTSPLSLPKVISPLHVSSGPMEMDEDSLPNISLSSVKVSLRHTNVISIIDPPQPGLSEEELPHQMEANETHLSVSNSSCLSAHVVNAEGI